MKIRRDVLIRDHRETAVAREIRLRALHVTQQEILDRVLAELEAETTERYQHSIEVRDLPHGGVDT